MYSIIAAYIESIYAEISQTEKPILETYVTVRQTRGEQ